MLGFVPFFLQKWLEEFCLTVKSFCIALMSAVKALGENTQIQPGWGGIAQSSRAAALRKSELSGNSALRTLQSPGRVSHGHLWLCHSPLQQHSRDHFNAWPLSSLPFTASSRYGDMRKEIGFKIRDMWYNLGEFQPRNYLYSSSQAAFQILYFFTKAARV